MRVHRVQGAILACACMCGCMLGCAGLRGTEDNRPRFLEDMFDSLTAEDGRASGVQFTLKEEVGAAYAAREIEAYLRREPGGRRTRFVPGAYAEEFFMTQRDFWSMVLADMRGVELEPGISTREEWIQALLHEIARAPGRYPARRDPSFSPMAAALKKRLCETKPMLARFLGVVADEIMDLAPRSASPRDPQTAQEAGLRKRFIVSSRPRNLPERAYSWEGVVDFRLRSEPDEPHMGCCYFDPKMDRWLVDEVKRGNFLLEMPKRVEPVQGWNPLESK